MFLFFINNYGKIYIVVTLNIILLKGEIMSNKIKLTEGIFIESYKDNWGNCGIIIEKYGKEKKIHPKLKETNISLKGFDKKVSLEENQKSGKVLTIPETIKLMKRKGEKISSITSYDYSTARIVDEAGIDFILVGDSSATRPYC